MGLVDLKKKAAVSLQKKGLSGQRAKVALVIDISASMDNLFSSGTVQKTCERLLGLAMNFDDNQAADIFLFGERSHSVGELTENNFSDFVQKQILRKYSLEGYTRYAGVMKDVIDFYYPGQAPQNKPSLFGLFRSKKEEKEVSPAEEPVYVLFLTDGDNGDHAASEEVIREASKLGIFWQFVGIGRTSFNFLRNLDEMPGRHIDNANFFALDDLNRITDEELYDRMLTEFPSWIKEAKSKGVLK